MVLYKSFPPFSQFLLGSRRVMSIKIGLIWEFESWCLGLTDMFFLCWRNEEALNGQRILEKKTSLIVATAGVGKVNEMHINNYTDGSREEIENLTFWRTKWFPSTLEY